MAGKRVLVTGASSGLGRAAAVMLSRCGAQLALVGRDLGRLQQTRDMLGGEGHRVEAAALDGADAAAALVERLAAEAGGFSGVFHSAGTSLVLPAKLTKDAHIDELFAAGVRGALGVARAASKRKVVEDGGSLVFMSSVSSQRGRPGMVGYSAAKAAVDGMVRALAAELAPRRVRVNSIISGAVETEMHNNFVEGMSESIVAGYRDLHLLGFGRPDDVASAATFLLSDASAWITGTNMAVDGGYTAK